MQKQIGYFGPEVVTLVADRFIGIMKVINQHIRPFNLATTNPRA